MQLGLTIPLIKFLKFKNIPYGYEVDLLYCWELHILHVNNKDMLVIVNASNRFGIILYDMLYSDWQNLEMVICKYIRKAFSEEGYDEKSIDRYFKNAGDIELTKTHGRRPVAYLNKLWYTMYDYIDSLEASEFYQRFLMHDVNRTKCHATGFEGYGYAVDFLVDDMQRIGIYKSNK